MAKLAVADSTAIIACTPHVNPGVYDYDAQQIRGFTSALQGRLRENGVELTLVPGGDVALVPDLVSRLRDGRAPTLGDSPYFLLEPPHDLCPPGLDRQVERVIASGFYPILTHPERFGWIGTKIDLLKQLHASGCLVQVTAAALTGRFGQRARGYAEQFLTAGLVDILASDAHDSVDRVPGLAEARNAAARLVGEEFANHLVSEAPLAILNGVKPRELRANAPSASVGNVTERERARSSSRRLFKLW
jgi:protein-tyrosine phosphatase